ncbi:MAG: phosphoglucosamine mutase [Cytophagales bacterium]|nr:MAG: phosphoglucosamine mutase [Cytophagales bacterium]TAF61225.1 MAG: phosphoglucosamine mutase [Cytophagales bacterium]
MTLIKSISGIRGTIGGKEGDALTPPDVVKYAAAYGSWAIKAASGKRKIVIGRDARVSGAWVSSLVSATLTAMGIHVIDAGLATTPTVEMAVKYENAAGGIILTASHNPGNWNALKLLNQEGEFISAEEGQYILDLADSGQIEFAKVTQQGQYTQDNSFLQRHIDDIIAHPLVDKATIAAKNFSIVVDGVNSVGGVAVPALLAALGVKRVEKLFCEPTGIFEHNPEPLPENITHICQKLYAGQHHLGIVVDPDVDRLALVCEDGTPFGEEYTLVAVADYVLSKTGKGNTVSNLSSTRALADVTQKYGGQHFSSAVGEVNVVKVMRECQAIIGGEGNGGIIVPDLHYGRDALIGIALFLSHLANFKGSAKMLRNKYPSYYISKNKIELTSGINTEAVLRAMKEKYSRQPINEVDGVKIDFGREWVHLRRSNTEPIIRIYAESDSEATAEHLAQKIISDIKEMIK